MYRLNQQRYLDWCLEYIHVQAKSTEIFGLVLNQQWYIYMVHVQAISTEIFGLVFGIYTCTG